jgi:nitrite reductase/ring-hydroxylating ferredoxin subunit
MNKTVLPVDAKYLPKNGQTSIIYYKNKEICVINQEGNYYAIDNLCPHAGASLGIGRIDGDEILCPLHEFRFNFKNGLCSVERFKTSCYIVEKKNND